MKILTAVLLLAAYLHVDCSETLTNEEKLAIVNKHNEWRGDAEASNMFKLAWDDDLATIAQDWADKCEFKHNEGRHSQYLAIAAEAAKAKKVGENLYMGSTRDVSAMMQEWYDEVTDYDLGSNTCSGTMCFHYTQIMWATTKYIGCGMSHCKEGSPKGYYLVCNYGPAGNWVGKAPFQVGAACSACKGPSKCVDNRFCEAT